MTNAEKKTFLLAQLEALEAKRNQLIAFEKELLEISKKCGNVVDANVNESDFDYKFLLKVDSLNCIGRDAASWCYVAYMEMERNLDFTRDRIIRFSNALKGENT